MPDPVALAPRQGPFGPHGIDAVGPDGVPPRHAIGHISRPALAFDKVASAGSRLVLVTAPSGFGKTYLLAQWHGEAILRGHIALWQSLSEPVDGTGMLQRLAQAGSQCGLRGFFGKALIDWLRTCDDTTAALLNWLAEIAKIPREVTLFLDDGHNLSGEAGLNLLLALLQRAPANLRLVIAMRPDTAFRTALAPVLHLAVEMGAPDLRFREEETVLVVQQAIGAAQVREALQIHAMSDGWPLGVRLAVLARLRKGAAPHTHSETNNGISEYHISTFMARQTPEVTAMLTAIAYLDPVEPDLCDVLLGPNCPSMQLTELAQTSVILARTGASGTMRLHKSILPVLQQMHDALPRAEQARLALCSGEWYERAGMHEAAATQFLRAGQVERALGLAEKCARQIIREGRDDDLVAWHDLVRAEQAGRFRGFLLPLAWTHALGGDEIRAEEFLAELEALGPMSEAEAYECHLIRATCAALDENAERFETMLAVWPQPPAWTHPDLRHIHLLAIADHAWMIGDQAETRKCLAALEEQADSIAPTTLTWLMTLHAMSLLWDGKAQLAVDFLTVSLSRAATLLNPSSRNFAMLAATQGVACHEAGRTEEAKRILEIHIGRIDRKAPPELIMLAHFVLADIADTEGRPDEAEIVIGALRAHGRDRGKVRLQIAALLWLARHHARQGRFASAEAAFQEACEMAKTRESELLPLNRLFIHHHTLLTKLDILVLARGDVSQEALAEADEAVSISITMGRGYELAWSLVLRSRLLEKIGNSERATADMAEAQQILTSYGLRRGSERMAELPRSSSASNPSPQVARKVQDAVDSPTHALTGKQLQIVRAIEQHLSNKEIARAMNVAPDTIKWHLKILFQRLGATDRRSVVSRAKALGLI